MKHAVSSTVSWLCLLALTAEALAANVVQMSFSKRDPQIDVMSDLGASIFDRALSEDLFNNITGGSYMADVKVGTPPQSLSLVIDTGSSDTWVLSKTADECSVAAVANKYGGCVGGTFDSKASSSFKSVAPGGFNISYADQTGSSGDFFKDNFQVGGATIKDLQMGLALKVTTSVGIMGIAYPVGESTRNQYPNIIDQMVSQKLINLRAYSLWLDDKETSTGSVLFGGIDTEKFIGTLKSIPVQPDTRTKTIRSFTVSMTGLSVTDDSGTATQLTAQGYTLPVILDSGTTISYVPAKLLSAIIQSIGAVDDTDYSGFVFVDCDWRTTRANSFLSFSFGDSGGPTINVPLSELIRSFNTQNVRIKGSPFQNTCNLGILAPSSGSTYLFGDTFLRSAYVVYDIDHDQIALAQTNFEATGSNVQDIPSSATAIPLLSGKSSGQTVVPQSHFTGKPSSTGTATSRKSSTTATTPVAANSGFSTNTGYATGTASGSNPTGAQSTQTSKAAAVGAVPAFETGGLMVLVVSSLFALAGGSWFLAY